LSGGGLYLKRKRRRLGGGEGLGGRTRPVDRGKRGRSSVLNSTKKVPKGEGRDSMPSNRKKRTRREGESVETPKKGGKKR